MEEKRERMFTQTLDRIIPGQKHHFKRGGHTHSSISSHTGTRCNPLGLAMLTGFKAGVKVLIEAMPTALLDSVCASWLDGHDIDMERTPLGVALAFDSPSALAALLARGANPNEICERSPGGTNALVPTPVTPVALAVHSNNPALLEALLNAGAKRDVSFTFEWKPCTALELARKRGYQECVRVLQGEAAEVALAEAKSDKDKWAAMSVGDVCIHFARLGASDECLAHLRKEQVDGEKLRRIPRQDLHDLIGLSPSIIEQHERWKQEGGSHPH